MSDASLIEAVKRIASGASERILAVYGSDFGVVRKDDESPLTRADMASHDAIQEGLTRLTPETPVLSEESADEVPFATRSGWERYWLVDPLDGTKEFINRNGEFTVNIALVRAHRPVLGVVWVPVSGLCYYGAERQGAFRQAPGSPAEPIRVRRAVGPRLAIAGSRSHGNEATRAFMERLQSDFPESEIRAIGSSLKLCLVAEGSVDIYPRFGPTSEWDTAAAQCVVEAAGGRVTDLALRSVRYNTKESVLNPHFLAFGPRDVDWARYLPAQPGDVP